jgi:hypothetical protein
MHQVKKYAAVAAGGAMPSKTEKTPKSAFLTIKQAMKLATGCY